MDGWGGYGGGWVCWVGVVSVLDCIVLYIEGFLEVIFPACLF